MDCDLWYVRPQLHDCHLLSCFNTFQGEENLGMAMTFTLVSHLREQLSDLVKERADRREREESEKERLALEVRLTGLIPT